TEARRLPHAPHPYRRHRDDLARRPHQRPRPERRRSHRQRHHRRRRPHLVEVLLGPPRPVRTPRPPLGLRLRRPPPPPHPLPELFQRPPRRRHHSQALWLLDRAGPLLLQRRHRQRHHP